MNKIKHFYFTEDTIKKSLTESKEEIFTTSVIDKWVYLPYV